MIATLKFTLPEEREEFEDAMAGSSNKSRLDEIVQQIFRPARKHGYSDQRIQLLIEALDSLADKYGAEFGLVPDEYGTVPGATELVARLEQVYFDIANESEL